MNTKLNSQLIAEMHRRFGVNKWVAEQHDRGDHETLREYVKFRVDTQLREELEETSDAVAQGDAEEIVDGLVDILVFAYGTLNVLGVDADEAFSRVMHANLEKEPGIKPGRPNPWGMPDLIKPEGWTSPNHNDNHGILDVIYHDERNLKW